MWTSLRKKKPVDRMIILPNAFSMQNYDLLHLYFFKTKQKKVLMKKKLKFHSRLKLIKYYCTKN